MRKLLTPGQVDAILQYPSGRAKRLARAGKLPSVTLPDGELRIPEDQIERIANGEAMVISQRRAGEPGAK